MAMPFHHDAFWKETLDTQTEVAPLQLTLKQRGELLWQDAHDRPWVIALVVAASITVLLLVTRPPFLFVSRRDPAEDDDETDEAWLRGCFQDKPRFSIVRLVLLAALGGGLVLGWPYIKDQLIPRLTASKQ